MASVDKLQNAEEDVARMREEAEEARWEDLKTRSPLEETATRSRSRIAIAIKDIRTDSNIRPDLPEIMELAESIKERGVRQAPLVSSDDETGYSIVAGARRLAALSGLYGRDYKVECDVIEDIDEAERIAMMLVENEQRQQIDPLITARALRELMRRREHASAAALARSLGLSSRWVQDRLRLLDLPDGIQERVSAGDLSFTLADLLRRRVDDGSLESEEAVQIADAVASGDTTASEIREQLSPTPPPSNAVATALESYEDDEWDEDPAIAADQARVATLDSAADALLESYVGPAPVTDTDEEAPVEKASGRGSALALAQLLAVFDSYAADLGITDPWVEVPALSIRERDDLLERLAGRVWDTLPVPFRSQFA
jgi:ParB/RepB/Spo0J family partition protein